eukprot:CAMPEP_0184751780 /NCGR_PEP_ID=MMETSP0315-20130426/43225_1 /TAXON_ID=101924 /ORGANISM="Rhodosorus marinus, Strain UTEX LB 2760" /LENGTH=58 /DNA_ID=CAMNT_0027231065 /DNA_START=1256 /DNA_END=1432 /DNA_ORIENTATION=+
MVSQGLRPGREKRNRLYSCTGREPQSAPSAGQRNLLVDRVYQLILDQGRRGEATKQDL